MLQFIPLINQTGFLAACSNNKMPVGFFFCSVLSFSLC
jgi:hypothetical protein